MAPMGLARYFFGNFNFAASKTALGGVGLKNKKKITFQAR